MGPCALRDKPPACNIEINDDIVAHQARELSQKHTYQVQSQVSQEELLVSLAANMQAMSQNIRSKNAFHLTKLQRVKKSKIFNGFVTMVKKKLPPAEEAEEEGADPSSPQ